MFALPRLATLCLTASLVFATSAALAAEHVSVARSQVNLRSGPGTQHQADWLLAKGYPLLVLQRKGAWLQVKDVDGDRGWVYRTLTNKVPHHVVKAERATLRKGPGTQHPKITTLEQGEVLRTRQKTKRWVKVETSDGLKGWVARSLLWGW